MKIVKKGRLLSQKLRDELYFNDVWTDPNNPDKVPKQYSWICVNCGGEYIFKYHAQRCCSNPLRSVENAGDEIITKGYGYRGSAPYGTNYDEVVWDNPKPKAIDFIHYVERQIRLLEKEIKQLSEYSPCQLLKDDIKKLEFYKEFLPLIKELKKYDEIMEVIRTHDYSPKEIFGYGIDYQCEHCPYYCFKRFVKGHDITNCEICKPCEKEDCSVCEHKNNMEIEEVE